jgi:hypothetical protein
VPGKRIVAAAGAGAAAAAGMVVAAVAAAMMVVLRPKVRVEIGVIRMQVRVPGIQIGNYLAQSRTMRLANVQTFGSQCLASKRPKTEFYLCRR